MKNKSTQRGFTLIELMLVIAIIGILAAVALPAYQTYTNRSRFSELIIAATPFKTIIELDMQTSRIPNIANSDSGSAGLAAAVTATATVHGSSVTNGVITMEWMNDSSVLDGLTYILTPTVGATGIITWAQSGTCQTSNYC